MAKNITTLNDVETISDTTRILIVDGNLVGRKTPKALMKSTLTDYVTVLTLKQSDVLFTANTTTNVQFDETAIPDGYSYLAYIIAYTNNGQVGFITFATSGVTNTTLAPRVIYRNYSASDVTGEASVKVLLVKDL